MSEFEIRIPARKKQPATDKDNPVVKVSTGAYNALVEIYNESTLSMKDMTRRNSNGNASIVERCSRV